MGCCKCEASYFGWDDPRPTVFKEKANGNEYCIFHAPKGEKWKELGGAEQHTDDEFNALIFSRIEKAKANNTRCDLRYTVFPGHVSFWVNITDQWLPEIRFNSALFCGDVDFGMVRFNGVVTFDDAIFSGQASFTSATFQARAAFERAEFNSFVDFRWAKFKDEITFDTATFKSLVYFVYARHERNGIVLMMDLEPSSVEHIYFSRAELPMFTFHNCRWPQLLGREIHGDMHERDLLECEELYRAMKQKASLEHDQPQVSNWHFREKLMQLQGLLLPEGVNKLVAAFGDQALCKSTRRRAWWELFTSLAWRRCIMLFWFWSLSGFGERPRRAGWWLGGLVLFPLLFLMPLKLIETGWSTTPDWQRIAEIIAEWVRCMPLVKLEATAPKQAPFVYAVRAGLSYAFQVAIGLQAALFALAVRNRFRR